jgi:hypothetical protein
MLDLVLIPRIENQRKPASQETPRASRRATRAEHVKVAEIATGKLYLA